MNPLAGPEDEDALEDAMARFVLGEMAPEQHAAFERRLADRPELAREVESLREALSLLPYAAAQPPPPGLRARVLAAAAALAPGSAPRAAPATRPFQWSWLAAAAACVVALAVGFQNARLRRQLEIQNDVSLLLQQPNVVLSFSLSGTDAGSGAFGRVVLDLDGRKGAVVIRHLPQLGEAEVYRLWALVGPQKVLCGEFNAADDGTVDKLFPIPVDAYTEPVKRLILTVEKAAPAIAPPTGPTVMIGA
jgi:anti-sigma-K factor RskA